jgi:hypothetical protein
MPTNNHGGARKGAGRPPSGKPRKVKIAISLDPALLAHADATGNRSAYIETLIRRDAMTPMTPAEIAALNAAYEVARAENPDESTHTLTHNVAIGANLEAVRHDDNSGTLYRSRAGRRYVYGWESGGFDDQIN